MSGNEELRGLIIEGIDSTLESSWLMRRFISADQLRLLRAMRRFWQEGRETQLDDLSILLSQEPRREERPPEGAEAGDGKGLSLLEDRLTRRLAADAPEFDITIILMIIGILIPLIQDCFTRSPRTLRDRPLNRSRLALAIRRSGRNVRWAEAFRLADSVTALADDATDEELQSLIDDCCTSE